MSNYLPKLSRIRNEVVFYLGVFSTIAAAVGAVIADADLTSPTGILIALPAITGAISRNFAFGPETVEAMKNRR
ncbi:MAG: hypothetical protein AAF567_24585 [Actinomycetota bacterium]